MFKIIFGLLFCLLALDAHAAEEQDTRCTYEVTQVFKDGELVSETKTRKCKEDIRETNKWDPDNNFKDHVKKKLVEAGFIALIIEIAKD